MGGEEQVREIYWTLRPRDEETECGGRKGINENEGHRKGRATEEKREELTRK